MRFKGPFQTFAAATSVHAGRLLRRAHLQSLLLWASCSTASGGQSFRSILGTFWGRSLLFSAELEPAVRCIPKHMPLQHHLLREVHGVLASSWHKSWQTLKSLKSRRQALLAPAFAAAFAMGLAIGPGLPLANARTPPPLPSRLCSQGKA